MSINKGFALFVPGKYWLASVIEKYSSFCRSVGLLSRALPLDPESVSDFHQSKKPTWGVTSTMLLEEPKVTRIDDAVGVEG